MNPEQAAALRPGDYVVCFKRVWRVTAAYKATHTGCMLTLRSGIDTRVIHSSQCRRAHIDEAIQEKLT